MLLPRTRDHESPRERQLRIPNARRSEKAVQQSSFRHEKQTTWAKNF
jgi:hypothetical protein